jgi:hypothetical protein
VNVTFTGITRMPVYQGSYTLDNSVTITPGEQSMQMYFYTGTGTETNTTDFTIPTLINRTVLFVGRPQYGLLQPVSAAPVGQTQIQFFPITGTLRVNGDYPIQESELFTILYR